MNESETPEKVGCRDRTRAAIERASEALMNVMNEMGLLRQDFSKNPAYRYAEIYTGKAIYELELASVIMRKRKRKVKKMEVPDREHDEIPSIQDGNETTNEPN